MKIKIEIPGARCTRSSPVRRHSHQQEKAAAQRPDGLDRSRRRLRRHGRGHRRDESGLDHCPRIARATTIPFTFNGAGLILYQDKDNFVRLERTAGVGLDNLQPIHKVLFEVVKDGKHDRKPSLSPGARGDRLSGRWSGERVGCSAVTARISPVHHVRSKHQSSSIFPPRSRSASRPATSPPSRLPQRSRTSPCDQRRDQLDSRCSVTRKLPREEDP